ncbi:hypothetical protein MLD38_001144 [Melastoma candidum]|uniref:Uncharacterized protein n=1 Tax=Melastoma candidum TaxID=119954 RepID=A0ACB9SFM3_9MYRT|nr:hypothetical protein MLD38_001144 [Melastoma candidum]
MCVFRGGALASCPKFFLIPSSPHCHCRFLQPPSSSSSSSSIVFLHEQSNPAEDLVNRLLNWVVPPTSLVILTFAWPALSFVSACEWLYNAFYPEDVDDKFVVITGASSGIGEREYAKRRANLVLVARRGFRLKGIEENARRLGARHVLTVAADVVKEDDCRRFVNEAVNLFGQIDHLVNTASLGHAFFFEEDINFWGNVYPTYVALPYLHETNRKIVVNASVENWLPLPRMSLYSAANAALVLKQVHARGRCRDAVERGTGGTCDWWTGGGVCEADRIWGMSRGALCQVPELVRRVPAVQGVRPQSPAVGVSPTPRDAWGKEDITGGNTEAPRHHGREREALAPGGTVAEEIVQVAEPHVAFLLSEDGMRSVLIWNLFEARSNKCKSRLRLSDLSRHGGAMPDVT